MHILPSPINPKRTHGFSHNALLFIVCGLWFVVFFAAPVFAGAIANQSPACDPVVLQPSGSGRYVLSPHVQFLEDKMGKWNIEQVSRTELAQRFQPLNSTVPSFGYTDSAYWLRVCLHPDTDDVRAEREWLLEVDYALLDHVDLYQPQEDGYKRLRGGDQWPFAKRQVRYHAPVFRLTTRTGQPQVLYLRISSEGSLIAPLTLWSPVAFVEKVNREQYFLGIYYGIILVMGLYNLFLFLSVRDRIYLYYVFYIFSFGCFQASLNGLGHEYLWPFSTWMANQGVLFFMGLFSLCMALFSSSFLQIKQQFPTLYRFFVGFMLLGTLDMVLSLAGVYGAMIRIATLGIMAESALMLIAGVACMLKGYPAARYFVTAWSVFTVGGVIYGFRVLGLLPVNFVTSYAIQIGSAMEVTLLALALADRINIERRKKLEAQQQTRVAQEQTLAELQRLDRLKDEFLANTSHELRTPLNGMIGIAETLLAGAGGRLPVKAAANLSMLVSSGQRLAGLVGDLLDIGKLKNQEVELQCVPLDIRVVADTVVAVCVELPRQREVRIYNDIDMQAPLVYGDENRLQQILYNLVGNAIKFTRQGEVRVSAKDCGERMEISVSDTGIGIPRDRLDDIFDSFVQIDATAARYFNGSGLGLAISRQLVELHGGQLHVESEVGRGSTFSFSVIKSRQQSLAAKRIDGSEALAKPVVIERQWSIVEPESGDHEATSLAIGRDSVHILVVDDDSVNLQVVTNHLAFDNVRVTTCTDGNQALAYIENEERRENGKRPDMLLLDIMMPGLSGYQVCRALRTRYSSSELPIIMLTANTQVSAMVQGFREGANDYLPKPFSREELLARISTHLNLAGAFMALKENLSLRRELVQRRETLVELQLVQRRLAAMLDSSEEAMVAVNEQGEITFCNHSFETRLGRSCETLLGEPVAALFAEESQEIAAEIGTGCLKTATVVGPCGGYAEVLLRDEHGQPVTSALALRPLELGEEWLLLLIARRPGSSRAADKLPGLDRIFKEIQPEHAVGEPDTQRRLVVKLMVLSLEYWTECTGTTRFELARQSGLWKVYVDKDGGERSQTLDRYLKLSTLPKKPRLKTALNTADYVLAACTVSAERQERLNKLAKRLRADM